MLSFCGAKVPSAHGVSLALPSSHAVPARQIWQPSTEPRPGAALKRPAGHAASASLPSSQYVPGAHTIGVTVALGQ